MLCFPWGSTSMKDGLVLPACIISSNGSCCLTSWGDARCSSLAPAAQGRDIRPKDRRVNNGSPPCNAHFSNLIFWCLFFYFFLSSWAFFTSRVLHTAILPSHSTGLYVSPEEATLFFLPQPLCWGAGAGLGAGRVPPRHQGRQVCMDLWATPTGTQVRKLPQKSPLLCPEEHTSPQMPGRLSWGPWGKCPIITPPSCTAKWLLQGQGRSTARETGGTGQQADLSAATVLFSLNGNIVFV